jgi:glutaredoxin 3
LKKWKKMSLGQEIQHQIDTSKVLVYAKSFCPHSKKAKTTLQSRNIPADIYDLDMLPNGEAIQAELARITGQTTVPYIFIAGERVGGNSDLDTKLQSGVVQELLTRVGIAV